MEASVVRAAATVPGRTNPWEWLERLNQVRAWAGMAPVAEAAALSADAQAAAEWLVDHDEFTHYLPDTAGPAAVRGGLDSNLAGHGGSAGAPTQRSRIDGWTNSLGHGTWNLHPGVRSVGYGEATNPTAPRLSFVAALNVLGAPLASDTGRVFTFPADGVTDFDLSPTPSAVTSELCGWAADQQIGPVLRIIGSTDQVDVPDPAAAAVVTVNGRTVPSCVLTGEDYGFLLYTDAMAIVPKDPFPHDATVAVAATWRGARSFTFRTAPAALARATRLAGVDRIGTAIASSVDRFGRGNARTVVLSRSDSFADALAGTPLAVTEQGPLLLTPTASLSPATLAEIRRVLPAGGTVRLLGGSAALSAAVETAVRAAGYRTVRVAGTDRFATAVEVARSLGSPSPVLVADGRDFHDALAAGAAAAHVGGAVLLTDGPRPAAATTAYLSSVRPPETWYVGWEAAQVAPAGAKVLNNGAPDATAQLVAEQFFPGFTSAGIAGSATFPDALTGGVHAASAGAPLLWVDPGGVPFHTSILLGDAAGRIENLYVYGGTAAVAPAVVNAIGTLVSGRWSGDRD